MSMTSTWSNDFALNLFNLKDKVVVITGGNGTLGAAYAQAFVLHGAKVVVTLMVILRTLSQKQQLIV
jgi:gluconate 5-dehydrogenase